MNDISPDTSITPFNKGPPQKPPCRRGEERGTEIGEARALGEAGGERGDSIGEGREEGGDKGAGEEERGELRGERGGVRGGERWIRVPEPSPRGEGNEEEKDASEICFRCGEEETVLEAKLTEFRGEETEQGERGIPRPLGDVGGRQPLLGVRAKLCRDGGLLEKLLRIIVGELRPDGRSGFLGRMGKSLRSLRSNWMPFLVSLIPPDLPFLPILLKEKMVSFKEKLRGFLLTNLEKFTQSINFSANSTLSILIFSPFSSPSFSPFSFSIAICSSISFFTES